MSSASGRAAPSRTHRRSQKGRRGAGAGAGWLLWPILLAAVIAGLTLLHGGNSAPVTAGSSSGALIGPNTISVAGVHAVGMPIPVGDAPVRPVRIVIDEVARMPATERTELGKWISHTQNPQTRIRLERTGRLSPPLSAQRLISDDTSPTRPGTGRKWLLRGATHRVDGAFVELGTAQRGRMLTPRVRRSGVTDDREIRAVHHKLAAEIAREIMITSNQGYGGSTAR